MAAASAVGRQAKLRASQNDLSMLRASQNDPRLTMSMIDAMQYDADATTMMMCNDDDDAMAIVI